MTKAARTLVVLAVGATVALAPTAATAETGSVHDRSGDASRAADITRVKVQHGLHRIRSVIRIPRLKPRKLSGTELLINTHGKKKVYAVTVLRNRRGKVVSRSLSWRPVNNPVEPTPLPCKHIKTSLSTKRTEVSVPKSCLTKTGHNKLIKAKVRTINGTLDLQDYYFDDQTKYSRYLERGTAQDTGDGPEGQVTAKGGLAVRSLPTTASAKNGKLHYGKVYPLSCQVSGTLVYRDNDADNESSNRWYRLPGAPREWVSALYMRSVNGAPPYCHGGLPKGSTVEINCKLKGQKVDGNKLWYNLPLGLWVPARYVSNTGAVPGYCTG